MPNPFPCVLFDFDGTLADGYPGITASVNALRRSYGLPDMSIDQVRPLVGGGIDTLLSSVVPHGRVDQDIEAYRRHYADAMTPGTRLYPDTERLLSALQMSGRKLGVCSNKLSKFTALLLAELGIGGYFPVVFGPEQVERAKPAPDMIWAAMRQLGAEKAETLYVGDMSIDIEAGRAAGVTVWVVATGSETVEQLETARPDRLFADLDGVRKAFLGELA